MYRIALIQNESEMLRYSWADVRPMLGDTYDFDSYTSENLDELYPKLETGEYDAIVVASNACNDEIVLKSLVEHKGSIERFLARGNGLLVSFQMKMGERPSFAFLPDGFDVAAIDRAHVGDLVSKGRTVKVVVSPLLRKREQPKEALLQVGREQTAHSVMQYPSAIHLRDVQQHCLNNNLVQGVYWIYLSPENPDNYDTVIEDGGVLPTRPLVIASRADFTQRILVSALAMDWQVHSELWANALRWVVRGRPATAVIRKTDRSDYDFRYLLSSLEIGKLPHAEYSWNAIKPAELKRGVHDAYILDPAWTPEEVDQVVHAVADDVEKGLARVFYFDRDGHGRPVLCEISRVRDYQIVEKNTLNWLMLEFPDDSKQGYWSRSFWATRDALVTLSQFGIDISMYRERVLAKLGSKDSNGSYDEVLGATCALLEVYCLLLGTSHRKTRRTEEWLRENMVGKTTFEKATAYDVLARWNFKLDASAVDLFRSEMLKEAASTENEFRLFRYAKTLFSLGFCTDAAAVADGLRASMDPKEPGKWINVPHTAAIVELLVMLQKELVVLDYDFDDMVFAGVQYIRRNYDVTDGCWLKNVTASAKSLLALREFEGRVVLPVDDALAAVSTGDYESRQRLTIDAATKLNRRLQETNRALLRDLTLARNVDRVAKGLALFSICFAAAIAIVTYAFGRYLGANSHAWKSLQGVLGGAWSQNWQPLLFALLFTVLGVLLYVLNQMDLLPDFVRALVNQIYVIQKRSEAPIEDLDVTE